jgi:hypothetical protein
VARQAQRPRWFADAGMAIMSSRPEDGPEIWCRCDGGPHGYLSIAAHGHADALSIEVRHDGVELLVDPGTYCYHGEPEWRQYFRSTAAHNTLQVGGADQAVSAGPFLWVAHPRSAALTCDVGDWASQTWVAQHDGYRRLETPVMHRRSVTLDSPGRRLTIVDRVLGETSVPVQLRWHLGPAVSVDLRGERADLTWRVKGQERRASLLLPGELSWTAHCGEETPISGWYSPGFGRRVPSTSLVGTGTGSAIRVMTSILDLP